jgi:hypothetical protein
VRRGGLLRPDIIICLHPSRFSAAYNILPAVIRVVVVKLCGRRLCELDCVVIVEPQYFAYGIAFRDSIRKCLPEWTEGLLNVRLGGWADGGSVIDALTNFLCYCRQRTAMKPSKKPAATSATVSSPSTSTMQQIHWCKIHEVSRDCG